MKKIKITALSVLLMSSMMMSCKDQLDIQNPNQPTPASAATESGVIGLAQGAIYINGFTSSGDKYYDGVVGAFYNGVVGFHEMMGDVVAAEAANTYMNNLSAPNSVTLDDGTVVANPNSPSQQITLLRNINVNAQQGGNPGFHEWALMYGLNNAANSILEVVEKTTFSGDAATKKNTVKAWAYLWKGFAYARIGSIYYAGLINNASSSTNGNYVAKEKIIEESNANYDKAAALLGAITNTADYSSVLGALIPSYFQTGKGVVPTTAQFIKNLNTLKARNIIVNTPVASMTAAQWNQILTLTNAGVGSSDPVFAGNTNTAGDIFSPLSYSVAARCVGANASGGTFKISERLIQDFNTGDKRLANNFNQFAVWVGNSDRGNAFNTRWGIKDGGNGLAGVMVYTNRTAGMAELYMLGSYEENELMKAEAKLYTGDIAGAATSINNIRTYQGAGLAALASTDLATVKEELRKERRVALAFRGLAFYDARRWGVLDSGRKNAVVISKDGKTINTKASITYGYLDYWDVPDNELAYNPAAAGSAPIKNPKQ
ncbi:RagB/SusD family nutrient uptake outer membrane protein [Flectobacillus longus]|uniref:RagB/SusD family nutrient uptake outer membrane protein n=1 Tax=Flectobacillus longus TaxID=2984207 RepID=UPI0024B69C61|nr:RagB/SusD family nutrient uptake outer membrane protein [Flectobacillus longus]MDI9880091.1 RagB/SusD family nutrient uptake outer membrane protein [Flectobacillus longus]